jgi:aspartate/methionine/tyrosine aminotransferase
MLESPLAPYLLWAKTRQPAAIDLAGSNLLPCSIDELAGAREALDLSAPNDNGYAPLVNAIAAHYDVDSSLVVTAAGCSGANFLVAAALVGAGDEVLVEQPTYDPLPGACLLMGASVRRFPRRAEDRWAIDVDALRAALTPRTRLVVVTSPHNPSGALIDRATLLAIGRLAADAGASVLVDEVYLDASRLAAPDAAAPPPAATLAGPFLSTSSLTKSYGLAGLRCGWIVTTSAAIAERLRRTRDVIDNAGSAPADLLGALAFSRLDVLAARTRGILGPNLAIGRDFLRAHPMLEVAGPPQASVVFPRLRGVSDAGPFIDRLLTDHDVAVAPGRFFDAPAHFRVSLAGRTDRLRDGLDRLSRALARA